MHPPCHRERNGTSRAVEKSLDEKTVRPSEVTTALTAKTPYDAGRGECFVKELVQQLWFYAAKNFFSLRVLVLR